MSLSRNLGVALVLSAWACALSAGCEFDEGGAPPVRLSLLVDGETPLRLGQRVEIRVIAASDDGFEEQVLGDAVEWSVADGAPVEVDASGEVRAVRPGVSMISAYYLGALASVDLEVADNARRLHVQSRVDHLPTGLRMQYTGLLEHEVGAWVDVTDQIAWTTSDPKLATVSPLGVVTGVAPGRVQVAADGFGLGGGKSLEIKSAVTTAVVALPRSLTMAVGTTARLSATASFSDGNVVDVTESGWWQSSLAAVAEVDRGQVRARAVGDVSITVSIGDETSAVLVRVVGSTEDDVD